MKIGDKILTELDKQGKHKKELAEYIGVKPASLSDWNNSDNLRFWNVVKASEFLGLSLNYLAYDKEPSIPTEYKKLILSYQKLSPENQKMALGLLEAMYDVQTKNENQVKIKTTIVKLAVNKASAGTGYDLYGNESTLTKVVYVPEIDKADYAIQVSGNSMMPVYENGDIVLVKEQESIEIGQIGIFTIDNSKGYIKKLGDDRLISLNSDYDDILFKDCIDSNGTSTIKTLCLVVGKTKLA